MPAPRNRRHLIVPTAPKAESYRPHGMRIPARPPIAHDDLLAHARGLSAALRQAEGEAARDRSALGITVRGAEPGLYIEFEAPAGVELDLARLENRPKRIEVVAVQLRQTEPEGQSTQIATVFVPDGALKHFFARFEEYATGVPGKKGPRHAELVDRIAAIRRATLRALWTDDPSAYPKENQSITWEVWLRRVDGRELERLLEFAGLADLEVGDRRLAFDDRLVVLVRGTATDLAKSLDVLNDVAEVRLAKETAAFFVGLPADEQANWIRDLRRRTTLPAADSPAVCILDTGVNRAHPLLSGLIASTDASAVDPNWGAHDDGGGPAQSGHGTAMAGLAAYGDLISQFSGSAPLVLRHRVESVKLLPPMGANKPELYGALTAQAVGRPEVVAPDRARVFSLAITAKDQRDRGQPTSWSAAIDALAAGRAFDPANQGLVYVEGAETGAQRLFVVSAGNVDTLEIAHLDRSDLEAVHDPGQAWNALTVGACTEKVSITDPALDDWSPVARAGDLSLCSSTSVIFQSPWPIKPDLVFEGGNAAHDGALLDSTIADLCLLSTNFKPAEKPLTTLGGTSASAAQVARIAAIAHAEYPSLWPESVRGLLVHSARWTPAMQAHFDGADGKRARTALLRRYGFGVPSLDRALRSANDSLTLVAQAVLRPFLDGKMREMHLHALPWPREVLRSLGASPVRLRLTLSYFIEPNPGRRGWKHRHRYASHGLRFDLKLPTESPDEFRKRLNKLALDEDEGRPSAVAASAAWYFGEQARNRGSLHSDIWVGTAADLADRGLLGIYPVSGWWKDQPKRDRSDFGARYAALVSIETDEESIDVWTPVAISMEVPAVEVDVSW